MADKIRLRVVTPTRLVLDEDVDEVTAHGRVGRVRCVAQSYRFSYRPSSPGELTYKQGATKKPWL